jgi:hypothetical protein
MIVVDSFITYTNLLRDLNWKSKQMLQLSPGVQNRCSSQAVKLLFKRLDEADLFLATTAAVCLRCV